MITPELINYVREEISKGTTTETIKNSLKVKGWKEADIEQVFSQININQPENPASPTISASFSAKTVNPEDKPKHLFDLKKMKWYEWLALIPAFFLLVQGGAIGAGIGVLGWSISLKVLGNENISGVIRALSVFGITVGYILAYFIIASIFVGIIQGIGQP